MLSRLDLGGAAVTRHGNSLYRHAERYRGISIQLIRHVDRSVSHLVGVRWSKVLPVNAFHAKPRTVRTSRDQVRHT